MAGLRGRLFFKRFYKADERKKARAWPRTIHVQKQLSKHTEVKSGTQVYGNGASFFFILNVAV